MSRSQRTRVLVDPSVQWTIAGRILAHWILFLACLISISAMVQIIEAVGQQPFAEAWRSAALRQVPILGVMVMLLPIFLRDTLKISNRFAGPMFRLRTALHSMARKEPVNTINFRVGDFWQDAADDFNTVLSHFDMLRQENEALRAKLSQSRDEVEV